jgi:hypothetical protein
MEASLPSLGARATPQAIAEARKTFRAEHGVSTWVYGSIFVLGLIAIGLSATSHSEPRYSRYPR